MSAAPGRSTDISNGLSGRGQAVAADEDDDEDEDEILPVVRKPRTCGLGQGVRVRGEG
jgi:hypothetical protein